MLGKWIFRWIIYDNNITRRNMLVAFSSAQLKSYKVYGSLAVNNKPRVDCVSCYHTRGKGVRS